MGTISRPGRSRHDSGRSILNFRGREKEALLKEQAKAVKDLEKVGIYTNLCSIPSCWYCTFNFLDAYCGTCFSRAT